MGVLSKILAGEKNVPAAAEEKNTADNFSKNAAEKKMRAAETEIGRPTKPCPNCRQPYGRHFWKDAYGAWWCTQCRPPIIMAMVRDEIFLDDAGDAAEASEDIQVLANGDLRVFRPAQFRGRWQIQEWETKQGRRRAFQRISIE